eukprot:jgi/Hompol1/4857/HPOL_003981-RA
MYEPQDEMDRKEQKKLIADCIKALEETRRYASRSLKENLDPEEALRSPSFQFVSQFVTSNGLLPETRKLAKVADTASGSIAHLNLSHVARLESELHTLYGGKWPNQWINCNFFDSMDQQPLTNQRGAVCLTELVRLDQCISTAIKPNIMHLVQDHVHRAVSDALHQTNLVMEGLLDLQVLIPAPPLPDLAKAIKNTNHQMPTVESILATVPTSVRTKLQEPLGMLTKRVIAQQEMHRQQVQSLTEELDFHQSIYSKYNAMIAAVTTKLDDRRKQIVKLLSTSIEPLVALQTRLQSLEMNQDHVMAFLDEFETALNTTVDLVRQINAT